MGTLRKLLDWAFNLCLFDMSKIKVFVLDEADVMIRTQEHHRQILRIQK